MISGDVVVAAATPAGRGALSIVRLTGERLEAVLARVVRRADGSPLAPGAPRRVVVSDADGVVDDGVAWWRPGPGTPTGQDLCELTVHGNPLIVERVVHACLAAGARLAHPGEFTRRAVLGGRLDLLRAEAVDQVVRATGAEGLRVARDGLDGRVGAVVEGERARLIEVCAELEARLDWPGDELALADDDALRDQLRGVADRCRALAATARAGQALVDGARVALIGAVNAGKSSLFNALLGRPRALVHAAPGTTRDVLEVRARFGPLEVTLLDTAGERVTDDPVEAMGQALARELVGDADLVVVVLRAGAPTLDGPLLAQTEQRRRLVVWNGVDRADAGHGPPGALRTSATTGEGVDGLRDRIVAELLGAAATDGLRIASARQRDLLQAVAGAVDEALAAWDAGPAVVADAVAQALAEIDALTGADRREDVLDAVFARFCIGK